MVCKAGDGGDISDEQRADVDRVRQIAGMIVASFRETADLHRHWTDDHKAIVAIAERWAAEGDVRDVVHAMLILKVMVPIVKGQGFITRIYSTAIDTAEQTAELHMRIIH